MTAAEKHVLLRMETGDTALLGLLHSQHRCFVSGHLFEFRSVNQVS